MLFKRLYDQASVDAGNPRVTGLLVQHTGGHAEQNFSTKFVLEGMAAGLVKIDGDKLVVLCEPEALIYAIKRRPGYYCCHDGKPIPISELAQREALTTGVAKLAAMEARAYLKAAGFEGKPSPDSSNPSGYQVVNQYECVLDAKQHAKYKAVPGAPAMLMNLTAEG